VWREEGLRVIIRRNRRRIGSSAPESILATATNTVCAVGFQSDATSNCRPVEIASLTDGHTRECLGEWVERSITADWLIDELDRIVVALGLHQVLRCENGPELATEAVPD
jgi:putative transposase